MYNRHIRYYLFVAGLSFCLVSPLYAQFNLQDSIVNGVLFSTNYGYNVPAADMAKRFGDHSCIGESILLKRGKNWLWGIEGSFLFGGKVKEDSLFKNLQNSNGDIIGEDGYPAVINLSERGFFMGGKIGKLIPMWGSNVNSGLLLTAAAGFLQHKIRIDIKGSEVPQLNKEYRKGYDRLSNGFAVGQYIGWLNLDTRKMLNFHVGFECIQAFTRSRRDWNFDTVQKDDKSRLDLFFGLKIGWILPIYHKAKGDITY